MGIQSGVEIVEPKLSKIVFGSTKLSWLWLIIRVYVGWQWLEAGWGKLGNPAWTGSQAGAAVRGFLAGALTKSAGAHPDVSGWYAYLIRNVGLPHATLISHLVTYSEIIIGIALILGLFTGIAAFVGSFMNLNFLFAGTVSINPLLALLGLFLILAWRVAGWYGLDHFVLPALGTPWQKGNLFKN